MKAHSLLCALFLGSIRLIFAQTNSLVGTWMTESDTIQEIKILTPTHYSFVVLDTKNNKLAYTGYGTYSVQNGKYTESGEYSNVGIDKSKKLEFDYKLEGDKFYQTGSVTTADGKVLPVNNTFTKVKLPAILTLIEKLTGIRWHLFQLCISAARAGNF